VDDEGVSNEILRAVKAAHTQPPRADQPA